MPEQKAQKSPPGIHLAFLYALAMPGLGEYLLGARRRGALVMALVCGCFFWGCWVLVDFVQALFSLRSPGPLLLAQLAIALCGILLLWLWGMLAAVDVAIRRGLRKKDEHSAFWAVFMSWLCPGAGQLYTGSRSFGFGLFACYLLAVLYTFPAYKFLVDMLRPLLANGSFQYAPFQALAFIKKALFRLDYGFANLAVQSIEAVSMILAAQALRFHWFDAFQQTRQRRMRRGPDGKAPSERELPFARRTEARVLSILALGWLCPGSGQLLLQRAVPGWALFTLYAGGKICIGLLAGMRMISYDTAQALTWVPAFARLAAMLHGLVLVCAPPKPAACAAGASARAAGRRQ